MTRGMWSCLFRFLLSSKFFRVCFPVSRQFFRQSLVLLSFLQGVRWLGLDLELIVLMSVLKTLIFFGLMCRVFGPIFLWSHEVLASAPPVSGRVVKVVRYAPRMPRPVRRVGYRPTLSRLLV